MAVPLLSSSAAAAMLVGSPAHAFASSGHVWTGLAATKSTTGFDVSYPQCASNLPAGGSFGLLGVNDGKPWTVNPCLSSEYSWAAAKSQAPGLIVNTANPENLSIHWGVPGPQPCVDSNSPADTGCAYNYGWNAAADSFNTASNHTPAGVAVTDAWWLDVETANSWNGTAAANSADLQGVVDYLHTVGVKSVGVYSTGYQWGVITGSYQFASTAGVTDWVAGGSSLRNAQSHCSSSYSFSGGAVKLSQYPSGSFDGDVLCF